MKAVGARFTLPHPLHTKEATEQIFDHAGVNFIFGILFLEWDADPDTATESANRTTNFTSRRGKHRPSGRWMGQCIWVSATLAQRQNFTDACLQAVLRQPANQS